MPNSLETNYLWLLINLKEVSVLVDNICEIQQQSFSPEEMKHVGFQLKALDLKFRRCMDTNIRQIGFEGMSVINVWIIEYLAHNEHRDIFQKDIEKAFHIGKSSIAGTLKVMEEKGIIIRKSVAGDARLKKVCLTEKGYDYAIKMQQGKEDVERKVSAGISSEEMEHFRRILKKMQDNLTEKE